MDFLTTTGGAELTKISLDLVLETAGDDVFLTPSSLNELFVDIDNGEGETDPDLPPSRAEPDETLFFLPNEPIPKPRKLFLLELLLTGKSSPLEVGVLVARR